ncbi:Oidioi.mRNA.OKI2018_I69.chr1.g2263.t1.cds [Oikopleura dioica]|uniref:Oidioi.mRNA.OKI2018_I69.chr1.g2263.t1.cds n=1 Tax=Oikopleura dioica TaxID=34765 RepID=A0ABN7SUV3_OIKDI|nr:Oidioi.mRNA.OKI2018_I69.chr1.g2263.t1.cds [Oikopleura dioica]
MHVRMRFGQVVTPLRQLSRPVAPRVLSQNSRLVRPVVSSIQPVVAVQQRNFAEAIYWIAAMIYIRAILPRYKYIQALQFCFGIMNLFILIAFL